MTGEARGEDYPFLIGDVGGTNARFALANEDGFGPVTRVQTADYSGPGEAIRAFLHRSGGSPRAVAIACAGPVVDRKIRLTNAGWEIEGASLSRDLQIPDVVVVNDFEALAWALADFRSRDLRYVGGGKSVKGAPSIILGAGTGLGAAVYAPAGRQGVVIAGEGGHVTMPACTEDEARMLASLREEFGHVSAERLLSGEGLVRLHDWFGGGPSGITAAEVTDSALDGTSEISRRALDRFCAMLGTFAGNMALTLGARGGVYIAGGIVPRFHDFFCASEFRSRFKAKGRFQEYLEGIPTAVVLHPEPAMVGLIRILRQRLPS